MTESGSAPSQAAHKIDASSPLYGHRLSLKLAFCLYRWVAIVGRIGDMVKTLRPGEMLVVCASVVHAATWPVTWLDVREQQRLCTYRFAVDRRRHHAAHVLKRWVIGQLLGLPPQNPVFMVDKRGKPHIAGYCLHFNLSHSGEWVVVALRRDAEVGWH
ncbi:hypothetical protein AXE65_06435 [Ventosimonas gracilis]|uniref:4'-phosphopantetheinyl transferase N-terminal domain-containing protein n=1 Tax=Ventosimonas gracilis TaxID=1680762 RepID=A0A139SKN0_9GAMM|nr:hypothetical protein [Ventosimonas gracilis]KXU35057.1 hypothetical protein AXE65_06435 [Ventosimonas gracilis]